jgi:hypothetical protein
LFSRGVAPIAIEAAAARQDLITVAVGSALTGAEFPTVAAQDAGITIHTLWMTATGITAVRGCTPIGEVGWATDLIIVGIQMSLFIVFAG